MMTNDEERDLDLNIDPRFDAKLRRGLLFTTGLEPLDHVTCYAWLHRLAAA